MCCVLAAPIVLKAPFNKDVEIMKTISMPCIAVGKPEPRITWSRSDGKPINFDNNRIVVQDDGTLVITGVSLSCLSVFQVPLHKTLEPLIM
jgi:Immunoglobulin I-set domain